MGSGKSTLGPALAAALGRGFADSDAEVTARLGASIPELFARGEQPRFRAEEAAVVAALVERDPPLVLALGGGAFEDPGTQALLLERALVVHLEPSWETLRPLLAELCEGRPLLAGASEAEIEALFRSRSRSYAAAPLRVPVAYDGVEAAVERVLDALGASA